MDVKFYKCMHCGNIAVKVFDAGVPLVCCGEKMVELVAGSQDAALEKHVPAVEVEGNKVVVNVGSVDHPMLEEHWIQFICLVTDKGYQIHPLAPGEAPHAEFVIAEGETPLKVYEHCNLHGLWAVSYTHLPTARASSCTRPIVWRSPWWARWTPTAIRTTWITAFRPTTTPSARCAFWPTSWPTPSSPAPVPT